jgi:hypothetical protein
MEQPWSEGPLLLYKKIAPSAVLASHVAALGHLNAALDRAVGRTHAAMASASLRSADRMVVLEIRGVPLALAAKALRAMAARNLWMFFESVTIARSALLEEHRPPKEGPRRRRVARAAR